MRPVENKITFGSLAQVLVISQLKELTCDATVVLASEEVSVCRLMLQHLTSQERKKEPLING
jgi:hypothetical protein